MGRPCRCCEDPVVSSSVSSSSVSSISSSSVSSISSSSVSVECECGNTCSWTWSGSAWTKTEDNCVWDPEDCGDPVPCECYKPGIETPDPAVTYITPCIAESDCCTGGCNWMWTDEDGVLPAFTWFLDDDTCVGTEDPGCNAVDPSTGITWANCQCIAPTEAGTEPLQELSTNCRPADCGTCAYESVTDGYQWTWQLSGTSCTGNCSCDSKYSDNLGTAAEGRTGNANCFDQTW